MKNKKILGNSMLLLAAFIWGCAFVAQSIGMDYVSPFTFTASRSIIAVVVLIPVVMYFDKYNKTHPYTKPTGTKKDLLIASLLSGIFLSIGSNLQQIGLVYTTASKAGFITALYIIIVPILGIFLKHKVSPTVFVSVIISTVGLYLLCMKENLTLSTGDIYVFLCAFAFSMQILVVDYYASKVDCIRLSRNQFLVTAVISTIFMLIYEEPSLNAIYSAALPILYAGVLSSAGGFTLQIIGQKYTKPTVASLLMSLESVFAALAGFIILHEVLNSRELLGCILMFSAIILAQIPIKQKSNTTLNL